LLQAAKTPFALGSWASVSAEVSPNARIIALIHSSLILMFLELCDSRFVDTKTITVTSNYAA